MLVEMVYGSTRRVAIVDNRKNGYGYCVDKEISENGFVRIMSDIETIETLEEVEKAATDILGQLEEQNPWR